MKTLTIVLLSLASSAVSAQVISAAKNKECGEKAWLFSMAAEFRDSRMPPQQALEMIKNNHPANFGLNDAYVKKSINAVYFDQRFWGINSESMYSIVAQECVNPSPQYQPLQ